MDKDDSENSPDTGRSESGLDEVQMHLACLPERYMNAKFSLSAYIFCWTVLKLCQRRLRPSPVQPQAPTVEDGGNEERCSEDAERQRAEGSDGHGWSGDAAAQEVSDVFFDAQTWHSDVFSDFAHDGGDRSETPLGSGSRCCSAAQTDSDSPTHSPHLGERRPSGAERQCTAPHGLQWTADGQWCVAQPLVGTSGVTLDAPGHHELVNSTPDTNSREEAGIPRISQCSTPSTAAICLAPKESTGLQVFTEITSKDTLSTPDRRDTQAWLGDASDIDLANRTGTELQFINSPLSNTEAQLISASSVATSELETNEPLSHEAETSTQLSQFDWMDTNGVEASEQLDEVGGARPSPANEKRFEEFECSQQDDLESSRFSHSAERWNLPQDIVQPLVNHQVLQSDGWVLHPEEIISFQRDERRFLRSGSSDAVDYNEEQLLGSGERNVDYIEARPLGTTPVNPDCSHYSAELSFSTQMDANGCVLSDLENVLLGNSEHTLDKAEALSNKHTYANYGEVQCEKEGESVRSYKQNLRDGALECMETSNELKSEVNCQQQSFSSKTQLHREEKVILGQASITFTSSDNEEVINPVATVLRNAAGNDIFKNPSSPTPCPSRGCSLREFTVIPQKAQEVIYSDHSEYSSSCVMPSTHDVGSRKEVQNVNFDCVRNNVRDPSVLQLPDPVEILTSTVTVSPTNMCFEFSGDPPMSCKQITRCDLDYLSDMDEEFKKIPAYPKQSSNNTSTNQLWEEDSTNSHTFENARSAEQVLYDASSNSCMQSQFHSDYEALTTGTSLHNNVISRPMWDQGSDTNNNVTRITPAIPCTSISATTEQERIRFDCDRGHLFPEERDHEEDGDTDNGILDVFPEFSNRLVSLLDTPDTAHLADDESNKSPANVKACDGHRRCARGQLGDHLGGREHHLHFSAEEGEQTAGGSRLKDADVTSLGCAVQVRATVPSPHADGPHGHRRPTFAGSQGRRHPHASSRNGPEHGEPLAAVCLLGFADGRELESAERMFDAASGDELSVVLKMTRCRGLEGVESEPPQTERLAFMDVSAAVSSISGLEPIMEADNLQEGLSVMENHSHLDGQQMEVVSCGDEEKVVQEYQSNTHTESCLLHNGYFLGGHADENALQSSGSVSGVFKDADIAQMENTTTSLIDGSDYRDENNIASSVSTDLDSMNREEAEDRPPCPTGSSRDQGALNNKSSHAGKASKFSVFSRIPSFRRSKRESKGCSEMEPEAQGWLEAGEDVKEAGRHGLAKHNHAHPPLHRTHMSHSTDHLTKYTDRTKDDRFEKVFSFTWPDLEKHGQPKSIPSTRQTWRSSKNEDFLTLKPFHTVEWLGHKKSKSTDNLNLRMKLAMAHRSLSNLFENRSSEKENQHHVSNMAAENVKAKQSWRKLKSVKEAEMLKRTMSVPEPVNNKSAHHLRSESPTGLPLNGPDLQGLPSPEENVNTWCSGTISKTTGPQEVSGSEPSTESSESSPLHTGLSPDSLDVFAADNSDDISLQSPIHPGIFALTNQLSPSWARSLGSFEGLDTPMRPMTPKPQSPGMWVDRRGLHYPSRSVASSLCSLGQGPTLEGFSDRLQGTKTFRPKAGRLTSAYSFDSEYLLEDSSSDSQSQTSLVSSNSGNEPEKHVPDGTKAATQASERKAYVPPTRRPGRRTPGPRPRSELWSSALRDAAGVGADPSWGRSLPETRQRSYSDELLSRAGKAPKTRAVQKTKSNVQGGLGRLRHSGKREKARLSLSFTSPEHLSSTSLRDQFFSQSTPIGLDCLSWPRRVSLSALVITDGAQDKSGLGDECGPGEDDLYNEFRSPANRFGHPGGRGEGSSWPSTS
ncbi:uncharacterized protein LOC143483270 [Brachyhypopomus gauderio]|uniref:uncharacterized protein LOC143483270 n=1 Tax=Brachyhypopomus gauderio TaxID=698409 RepID=UPI004042A03B